MVVVVVTAPTSTTSDLLRHASAVIERDDCIKDVVERSSESLFWLLVLLRLLRFDLLFPIARIYS